MTPEFRAGERVVSVKLCCTECGGRAQGNASWTDGSGEICDACVDADERAASVDERDLLPASDFFERL